MLKNELFKAELSNRQLGLKEMFFFYVKLKRKESLSFTLKKDYKYGKHKLFETYKYIF